MLYSNPAIPDENFTYDLNGNRSGAGLSTGPQNRLQGDGTYTYGYDNEGNLVRQTENATNNYREYIWDDRNRLTQVNFRAADGTLLKAVSYAYDCLDRRVSQSTDITPSDGVAARCASLSIRAKTCLPNSWMPTGREAACL